MEDSLTGGTYRGDFFATSLWEDEARSLGSTSVSRSSVTASLVIGTSVYRLPRKSRLHKSRAESKTLAVLSLGRKSVTARIPL